MKCQGCRIRDLDVLANMDRKVLAAVLKKRFEAQMVLSGLKNLGNLFLTEKKEIVLTGQER